MAKGRAAMHNPVTHTANITEPGHDHVMEKMPDDSGMRIQVA
jgi:hypothetical protein